MTPAVLPSTHTALIMLLLSHLLELHTTTLLLPIAYPAGPKQVQSDGVKHFLGWLIFVICCIIRCFLSLLFFALLWWLHRVFLYRVVCIVLLAFLLFSNGGGVERPNAKILLLIRMSSCGFIFLGGCAQRLVMVHVMSQRRGGLVTSPRFVWGST